MKTDSLTTEGKGAINFNNLLKQKWLRIPFRNGLLTISKTKAHLHPFPQSNGWDKGTVQKKRPEATAITKTV